MDTQIKQRIVGIVVLLLLVIAITALLFYGAKQGGESTSVNKAVSAQQQTDTESTDKNEVQLVMPSDNKADNKTNDQISTTPKDVVVPNQDTNAKPIVRNFGQVAGSADNTAAAPLVPTIVGQEPDKQQQFPAREERPTSPTVAPSADSTETLPLPETSPAASDMLAEDAKNALPREAATEASPVEKSQVATVNIPAKIEKPLVPVVTKNQMIAKKPVRKMVSKVTTGNFVIKLGSFASPIHATNLAKQLTASGYHAYTTLLSTPRGVFTQVFVGPVSSLAEAKQKLVELQKKAKTKGIIINNKKLKIKK